MGSLRIEWENRQVFDPGPDKEAPTNLEGLIWYAQSDAERYIDNRKVRYSGIKYSEDKKVETLFVVTVSLDKPDEKNIGRDIYFSGCYPKDANLTLVKETNEVRLETDLSYFVTEPDPVITIFAGSLEEGIYKGEWQTKGRKSGEVKEKGTFVMKAL